MLLPASRCLSMWTPSTTMATSNLSILLSSPAMQQLWLVHQYSQNCDTLAISTLFAFLKLHTLTKRFRPEDFMCQYMWLNSYLPSATALITTANTGFRRAFHARGCWKSRSSTCRLPTDAARMGTSS